MVGRTSLLLVTAIVAGAAGGYAIAWRQQPGEWVAIADSSSTLAFPVLVNTRTATACVYLERNASVDSSGVACLDYRNGVVRGQHVRVVQDKAAH